MRRNTEFWSNTSHGKFSILTLNTGFIASSLGTSFGSAHMGCMLHSSSGECFSPRRARREEAEGVLSLRAFNWRLLHYSLHRRMEVNRPYLVGPDDIHRFHSNDYIDFLVSVKPKTLLDHTHACHLKRFNVGEDCPIFDGLFSFYRRLRRLPCTNAAVTKTERWKCKGMQSVYDQCRC
uniref:Histone deacetylase n=1 Tax=Nelumbo nucifera TaxID=4432 RepID=A0A822Y1Y1_NELNU|nr:TPA_asm: hypothetical protein HUJ06_029372 [Nelumbo nucifera]